MAGLPESRSAGSRGPNSPDPKSNGPERQGRDEKRPPMAVAMEWVSRITSVALTMVLPAWGGYWLDGKLGTGPWLLSVAALGGLILGMMQLMRMVGPERRQAKRR